MSSEPMLTNLIRGGAPWQNIRRSTIFKPNWLTFIFLLIGFTTILLLIFLITTPMIKKGSSGPHRIPVIPSKISTMGTCSVNTNNTTYLEGRCTRESFNTEEYARIYENRFLSPLAHPLSTFSIDVDTASYANVRRFLNYGKFPPKDAVRVEELINYFHYSYPLPPAASKHPFSTVVEMSACPWSPLHNLVYIGLKGREIKDRVPLANNLVFLLDVSGSMDDPHKLPLLKSAFKLLVNQLNEEDRVAIVVYAGSAGLVLPSTPGNQKTKVLGIVDSLRAGGSTAGGAGIQRAYKVAMENFIKRGNNRVILATDGDFNVGISSTSELIRIIEEKRKLGIFLTVLGFGTGNLKDQRMESLADKGNGNYYYIDNLMEAKKVFINELRATLFTIAKDVKIQVEFNPAKVRAYKLIGYENRLMAQEDFKDDTKDAGEIGAGHTVTALYEIIPVDTMERVPAPDQLKYQDIKVKPLAFKSKEILTLKIRYKEPDGDKSQLIINPVRENYVFLAESSENFRFSSAVAEFGLRLRDDVFRNFLHYKRIIERAKAAKGSDEYGYRAEFIRLVEICQAMTETNVKNSGLKKGG